MVGRFVNADAVSNVKIDVLEVNLYVYCMNNVIIMIDRDGYAPEYIDDQDDNYIIDGERMADISFGLSNIADKGCGVIAAYNVLLSQSSIITFKRVRTELINYGGYVLGFGYWGINPKSLVLYMRSKFKHIYKAGPITFFWKRKAKKSEAIIILLKWKGSDMLHYIAGIESGDSGIKGWFKFYNTLMSDEDDKSIDGRLMSFGEFMKYLTNKAIPLYFIGVRDKKCRW